MAVREAGQRFLSMLDGLFGGTVQSENTYAVPSIAAADTIAAPEASTYQANYNLLRSLYYNNGAYRSRAAVLSEKGIVAPAKGLRTLQHAMVEFYVATVWPGTLPNALPIQWPANGEDDAIVAQQAAAEAAIHQVWTWSNWEQKKQLFIREQAMLGDAFLYVGTRRRADNIIDRVFYTVIRPEYVTDLDVDVRGFVTYIRVDTPYYDRLADQQMVLTEEWWKERDTYKRWRTTRQNFAARQLTPDGTQAEQSLTTDMGIDFVPYVHAKFRDTGETRGMAPIIPLLEKQDEYNLKAATTSERIYRHGVPDMMLTGRGGQTAGVYQPPPAIRGTEMGYVTLEDGTRIWTGPPGYELENINAGVNFYPLLNAVKDDDEHITAYDAPEMHWYKLAQSGRDISGAALRTLLRPALAKAEEARALGEAELARADAMGLTIGQNAGLAGFEADTIGTYGAQQFEHGFVERDVMPMTEGEVAALVLQKAQAVAALTGAGAEFEAACIEVGFDPDAARAMIGTGAAAIDDIEQ